VGASPLFPPQHPTAASAAAELQAVIGPTPTLFGLARSRWWLDGLRQVVEWLRPLRLSGVYRLLWRLGIHYKRGRRYVHSPDPAYAAKVATIGYVRQRAEADPERITVLYEDEVTYYRRPTVAQGYAVSGQDAPRADQGQGNTTQRRIAACVDVQTGQLFTWQRAHFNVSTLLRCYQEVEHAYPDAHRLYLVQDNWPVHFHPRLLAAFNDNPASKLRLVRLPTYAPWLNPVEKLWRGLCQDVLHLHPWVYAWDQTQAAVTAWLDQWPTQPDKLLRLLGLLRD
jgi:hypothetical protein